MKKVNQNNIFNLQFYYRQVISTVNRIDVLFDFKLAH